MSGSRWEYVRSYESDDKLLPNTFMVLRIDGHSFHKFTAAHSFKKPNDVEALKLMDKAARSVMEEYQDVVMAFGESDEYSFLIRRGSTLYNRRESKILSLIVSLFTSSYVFHWASTFSSDSKDLKYPPVFDGRIVLYPTQEVVKDYFRWRQADTHINNLYNTTFWALVQEGGKTTKEANQILSGSFSKEKHEILFSQFGINYNHVEPRFRKGSILIREIPENLPDKNEELEVSQPPTPSPSLKDQYADPTPISSLAALSLHPSLQVAVPSPPPSSSYPTPLPATNPMLDLKNQQPLTPLIIDAKVDIRKTTKTKKKKKEAVLGTEGKIIVLHVDLIKEEFWEERRWLLA